MLGLVEKPLEIEVDFSVRWWQIYGCEKSPSDDTRVTDWCLLSLQASAYRTVTESTAITPMTAAVSVKTTTPD
ncbi:MAG: hypothetical protein CMM01_11940 [Rhodopirellula sp.]|nr:hypothetical protein [Rhodopirellula sp.]OUX51113.1 MAG: hypothetical protein CBE43_04750 [Rhodopirellula sp. TMED283]